MTAVELGITDDDTASTIIALSASPITIDETAGVTAVTITATLAGDVTRNQPTTVRLNTTLGGGAPAGDYTQGGTLPSTITIPAGAAFGSGSGLTINPTNNGAEDGVRTIEVSGMLAGYKVHAATISLVDDDLSLPGVPGEFAAVLSGSNAARLTWTEPAGVTEDDPILAYRLERLAGEGDWEVVSDTIAATATGHTDSGLAYDTIHWWRVSAQTSDGWGPVSDTATVTTRPRPRGGFVVGGGGGGGGAVEPDPEDLTEEQLARSAARRFNDVDVDDYYAAAVGWMLAHEITAGCTEDSFCAHEPATRQHFVTFLWRAAGGPQPEKPGSQIFADVEAGGYADNAIGWALEQGITTGCATDDDGQPLFCPGESATRAHVAAFLYRTATTPQSWGQNKGILRPTPDP